MDKDLCCSMILKLMNMNAKKYEIDFGAMIVFSDYDRRIWNVISDNIMCKITKLIGNYATFSTKGEIEMSVSTFQACWDEIEVQIWKV